MVAPSSPTPVSGVGQQEGKNLKDFPVCGAGLGMGRTAGPEILADPLLTSSLQVSRRLFGTSEAQ